MGFVISPRKKQRRYNGDTQFIYWFSCGGGGGGLLWILFFNWTKSSLNCCLMCLFNYDTTTFARNKSPLLANVSKKHTYFTFVLQSGSLTFAATDIKCIFMLISIQTVVGKKNHNSFSGFDLSRISSNNNWGYGSMILINAYIFHVFHGLKSENITHVCRSNLIYHLEQMINTILITDRAKENKQFQHLKSRILNLEQTQLHFAGLLASLA